MKLFRLQQIKNRYAISTATVARWIKAKKLPQPTYINNQRVWRLKELKKFEKTLFVTSFNKEAA